MKNYEFLEAFCILSYKCSLISRWIIIVKWSRSENMGRSLHLQRKPYRLSCFTGPKCSTKWRPKILKCVSLSWQPQLASCGARPILRPNNDCRLSMRRTRGSLNWKESNTRTSMDMLRRRRRWNARNQITTDLSESMTILWEADLLHQSKHHLMKIYYSINSIY